MRFILHFLLGFMLSFLGSIPPGGVSANAMRITVSTDMKASLRFIIGATLSEMIYCFVATHFSSYLITVNNLQHIIQLISIPIFVIMAIVLLTKKIKSPVINEPDKIRNSTYLIQGLGIGLLNPLQLPFWLTSGAYFISTGWLINEPLPLNIFIAGVCCGSFTCLTTLCLLLNSQKANPSIKERTINVLAAVILFSLAAYQLFNFLT